MKPSSRSGAPLATLLVAFAGVVALPISLHFEGNEGTAEPFLVVFPIIALVALAGAVVALRRRTPALLALNALAGVIALVSWIALLTYEGG